MAKVGSALPLLNKMREHVNSLPEKKKSFHSGFD
jgi:hypothetical protein